MEKREVPCPKCGSLRIVKQKPGETGVYLAMAIMFLILTLLGLRWALILSLGSFLFALLSYLGNARFRANPNKWLLECALCKHSFYIDKPDGSVTYINITEPQEKPQKWAWQ